MSEALTITSLKCVAGPPSRSTRRPMYQMSAISTAATTTEDAVAAAKTRAKGRDQRRQERRRRACDAGDCGVHDLADVVEGRARGLRGDHAKAGQETRAVFDHRGEVFRDGDHHGGHGQLCRFERAVCLLDLLHPGGGEAKVYPVRDFAKRRGKVFGRADGGDAKGASHAESDRTRDTRAATPARREDVPSGRTRARRRRVEVLV